MTLLDPWGHDGKTYDGKEMRLDVAARTGGRGGVNTVTDYAATPQGSPNNTVQVAAGTAIIPATGAGLFGSYEQANDATINSPGVTATGANPRWDLLILQVTTGTPSLVIVQGTASGSPSYPSLAGLDNYIVICGIKMPANKSIIDNGANGVIEDRRSMWTSYFVCTSTTRPGVPFDGQMIEETDTERVWIWDAANSQWAPSRLHIGTAATLPAAPKQGTPAYVSDAAVPSGAVAPQVSGRPNAPGLYVFDVRWDPPWNLPWGVMGIGGPVIAPQGGIGTSATDLTGLTATYTAVGARRIRIRVVAIFDTPTNATVVVELFIREGATTIGKAQHFIVTGGNLQNTMIAEVILMPTAGAHTYKASALVTAGTIQMNAAATFPAFLIVEDIGPNGVPV